MDTLDLPTRHPVLDVQVQADQRLREADRPILIGRRLNSVRIDHVLMNKRGIASPERVRAQLVVRGVDHNHDDAPYGNRPRRGRLTVEIALRPRAGTSTW